MTRSTSDATTGDGGAPFAIAFDRLRSGDVPHVGGKGANLGELAHAGFPVPDGFCVTTDAYVRFLDGVPELDALVDTVRGVNIDDVAAVRDVGARIRGALARTAVPDEVAAQVGAFWSRTGPDAAYAVRSSATAEDLPDASFAGQQDTILDVRGEERLMDAVRRCWSSLFTDRAIVYRARNGFDAQAVRIAVVVQRMVHADVSGVLFTVDPVTQHRHTLVIDAVEGLGEALVAGRIAPDAYRVDRRDLRILDRTLGDRDGTAEGPLLGDARLQDLARLGDAIETHFGRPQDVEWAFADGALHVLQARPITSLYPIDALRSPVDGLHVHFSIGHQQSMTRAMPPLSLSSVLAVLPGGQGPHGLTRTHVRVAGGRLYADLTPLVRHPLARRGVLAMLSQLDALAPAAVRSVMDRADFRLRPRPRLPLGRARFLAGIAGRVLAALAWRDLSEFRDRTEDRMDAFESDVRRRIRAASPGRPRGEAALGALGSIAPFLATFVPVVAAGVASTRLLARLASRWLEPEEVEALTLAIPGNVVNEMNVAIDDLADLARSSPDVAARFEALGEDAHAWLAETARVEGGEAFVSAFGNLLARYGARASAEIDLSVPRWREDPLPVLRVVASALRRDGPSYRERIAGQREARVAAFERLVDAAQWGVLGPARVRVVRRLYRTMLHVGGMREHHKFLAVRVLAAARESALELADRLVEGGAIDRADDAWFLTWPELLEALDHDVPNLRKPISERRAAHARDRRRAPPMIVTSDGEIPRVGYDRDGLPVGALIGNSVSGGVAEGTARVVRDPSRDELAPGEILVAEFTDPGWTPLFVNAAGLVLEVGGALTHGAVVAREYGIPAVVGVRNATGSIRSGQRVRVDGARGVVDILDAVDERNGNDRTRSEGVASSDR